jgi:hypothetical protein
MKTKLYIIVLFLTFSCAFGKKQVSFNEMFSEPKCELIDNGLLIKTENSKENSALLIYSIKLKIDKANKEIRLIGYQAAGKKFKNEFKIELEKDVLENIEDFKLLWIDQDGKENEIKINDIFQTDMISQGHIKKYKY